jgi:hypothetical protein
MHASANVDGVRIKEFKITPLSSGLFSSSLMVLCNCILSLLNPYFSFLNP